MDISQFLSSRKEQTKSIIKLHNLMFSITYESFDEVYEYIINSNFITGYGIVELANAILWCCNLRPKSMKLAMDLMEKIFSSFPEIVFDFKRYIAGFLGNTSVSRHFILALFEYHIFEPSILVERFRSNLECKFFNLFFAPELEKLIGQSISKMNYSFVEEEIEFYRNMDKLSKENWKLLKELRKTQNSLSKIANIIRSDNIDEFQAYLSQTNIGINYIIPNSIFEVSTFIKHVTMLEYSAFYSSQNIFKFLLLNGAKITKKLPEYAVAGGNYEIIHLCEQYNCVFTEKSLAVAVEFHHNEIFDYLKETYKSSFERLSFYESILYSNFYVFIKLLKTKRSFYEREINGTFPITLAALSNLNMLEYFIEIIGHQKINDVNSDYEALLYTAALNNKILTVKYLCEFDEIDVNVLNTYNFTPLLGAVQMGAKDVVRFFLDFDKKKVDLKAKTFVEWNVIHIAASGKDSEILKMLLEKDKSMMNETNEDGNTPLMEAIQFNSFHAVKILCETEGIDLKKRNNANIFFMLFIILHFKKLLN
ncbi:hypothetical protein TRFO_34650 [Tritrichomonas foetus]|uniref:DUF3447 domain-containing protein n=1 Tax=Tritrichomonas foetus TaxID=1144522 RepID=A0A1J4JN83_9EUKA|nr:hypothetical protein TRFO_34650 [Tritrichomonas foetus]|eukprot:OHS98965.1 hypothetical protein TRFO_34650 [Tritrichomonas foetus]